MTTDINTLKVGEMVWFFEYGSGEYTNLGKIVYLKDKDSSYNGKKYVCVETSEKLHVIEVDGGDRANIWTNSWEPKLMKAKQKQQEASRLLEQAARLFSESTKEERSQPVEELPK